VTSRWPARFFPRARVDEPVLAVPPELTDAFLDMDRRQSVAESAVKASEQVFPEREMREPWDRVAAICYDASAAYLALTTPHETTGSVPTSAGAADRVMRQLTAASRAVDDFFAARHSQLENAVASLAAVPGEAQDAVAAANTVRQQMLDTDPKFVGYPSVQAAAADLRDAEVAIDAALSSGQPIAVRSAAVRVQAAAEALNRALVQAPSQDARASRALASVGTRIAAVHTRAERLAPAFSSLLREFNAASSADLTSNEDRSRRMVDEGENLLARARSALASGNPEGALELTASLRNHLTDAEELIDAVTDRLDLLRTVRDNPAAKADDVRFKLRDAQMLAVSRGVTREWASVLDAQVERIERLTGELHGRHPDYWAYVVGLDAVGEFIATVVERIRGRSATSPDPGSTSSRQ
jgi:hypothetical protein